MTATFALLKEGSTGADVTKLQQSLKSLNYYTGTVDGVFGAKTKEAVMRFQREQGLTVDGVVGQNTWRKINQMLGNQAPVDKWVRMNVNEEVREIRSLINSRMGVAALNQLALEGFVGFDCDRRFYVNEPYGGFQTLMRVNITSQRSGGASIAIGYNEIRVVFNRFEDNIEGFTIERVGEETPGKIQLPD